MSGHCDFCQVWHSGSCCHPGRHEVESLRAALAAATAREEGAEAKRVEAERLAHFWIEEALREGLNRDYWRRRTEQAEDGLEKLGTDYRWLFNDSQGYLEFSVRVSLRAIDAAGARVLLHTAESAYQSLREAVDARALAAAKGGQDG